MSHDKLVVLRLSLVVVQILDWRPVSVGVRTLVMSSVR